MGPGGCRSSPAIPAPAAVEAPDVEDVYEKCAKACDERESMFLKLAHEYEAKRKHAEASIHDHRRIEARSCAAAIRSLARGARK